MAAAASEQLKQLMREPDNARCFDCNRPGTQWASVSHGIYVCLECSGQHRGLGVHISFVKSITMDAWTQTQQRMMICGGNKRLKEFFRSYQYPVTMSIQAKYSTKAAQFYRAMIKSEAEGKPLEAVPPSLEEGLATIEGTDHLFRVQKQPQSVISEEAKPPSDPPGGSWWSSARSVLSGAYSKASDVTTSAIGRVRETGVIDSVRQAASTVYDSSKMLGAAIVEKGKEVAQSEGVRNVTSKIGEISQKAYESASSAIVRIRGADEPQEQEMRAETLEELMRRDRDQLSAQENSTGDRFDPLQASYPVGRKKTDKIE